MSKRAESVLENTGVLGASGGVRQSILRLAKRSIMGIKPGVKRLVWNPGSTMKPSCAVVRIRAC